MQCLIIGYGSMGRRHARNMQEITPEIDLCIYDPIVYPSTVLALSDMAVIASPLDHHQEYIDWCFASEPPIPFLVEKPLGTLWVPTCADARSAVDFNYRFHHQWQDI